MENLFEPTPDQIVRYGQYGLATISLEEISPYELTQGIINLEKLFKISPPVYYWKTGRISRDRGNSLQIIIASENCLPHKIPKDGSTRKRFEKNRVVDSLWFRIGNYSKKEKTRKITLEPVYQK